MPYKYMFFICILIIIISFIFPRVDAKINELPLFDHIIFIDPGHGGRDSGAISGDLYEKDLVLDISLKLRDSLMEKGAIVYMTRDSDEDLSSRWDPRKKRGDLYRRILMYKKYNAEMYLSIHLNSHTNSSYYGAEVLYNSINKNNYVLGSIIMDNFKKDLGSTRRLITTDLYMYKNTTVPGVLIECGFISNPNERYLLKTKKYQQRIVDSITNSVIEYFS